MRILLTLSATLCLFAFAGCGSDAAAKGVGAQCASSDDCQEEGQSCITSFKGGYCGVQDCAADTDCPDGSHCATLKDTGVKYCFLKCVDKVECNTDRDVDNEANCSSREENVDSNNTDKSCVPPSA